MSHVIKKNKIKQFMSMDNIFIGMRLFKVKPNSKFMRKYFALATCADFDPKPLSIIVVESFVLENRKEKFPMRSYVLSL